jgi:hypothetical protein
MNNEYYSQLKEFIDAGTDVLSSIYDIYDLTKPHLPKEVEEKVFKEQGHLVFFMEQIVSNLNEGNQEISPSRSQLEKRITAYRSESAARE